MTHPTVGRKVYFCTGGVGTQLGEQPMDATVIYVHAPDKINIMVTDHVGNQFPLQKVKFLFDGGDHPVEGNYAYWMPYQVAQAKKQEAA